MNEKYNGWTNWETWNAYLWITNNEGDYNWFESVAKKAAAVDGAAAAIKEGLLDQYPLDGASLWNDLLRNEIDKINFEEIAAALREED